MGIGASLFLIAVGAILKFAVPSFVGPVNVGVIGLILIAVGALGLVITLFVWGPWSRRPPRGGPDVVEERRVYDDRRPPYDPYDRRPPD